MEIPNAWEKHTSKIMGLWLSLICWNCIKHSSWIKLPTWHGRNLRTNGQYLQVTVLQTWWSSLELRWKEDRCEFWTTNNQSVAWDGTSSWIRDDVLDLDKGSTCYCMFHSTTCDIVGDGTGQDQDLSWSIQCSSKQKVIGNWLPHMIPCVDGDSCEALP